MSTNLELASGYFTTRLQQSRQASLLPASAQFDLARSPIGDDELEDLVDSFRDTPQPRSGWGFSEMLGEVLSAQPKSVPVKDLQALQRNLVAQGYASPDQQATGQWDPSWYANLRRFDRDNYEKQRAGYHWYSAPVMSGVNAMTNTLPSRVFQGIVGAAKGLVLQAPETAERLGLGGGALAGAAIGAFAGPGGALLGAGIGGIIGLGADLFGDSEEEIDQSLLAGFLDVLTPWEEYREEGPKALWEDLGFVLSAASMASGAGLAFRGVKGGVGAVSALRGGTAPLAGGAAGPTMPLSLGRSLMTPTASTELGVFGTVTRAATRKFLPGSAASVTDKLARWSPIAFMNRTGPKVALDVFAGLSQAQMGPRLFGGIGQGSKQRFLEAKAALEAETGRDLTQDEIDELSKKTATTKIEESIANAPLPQTGIDVPLLGDAIDIAAFALYPTKLLPFGGGASLGKSAERMMGDTSLAPYINAAIAGRPVGVRTGRKEAKEIITPGVDVYMRLDYGIERAASDKVRALLSDKGRPSTLNEAWRNARAEVIQDLHTLPEEAGRARARELLQVSYVDETDFQRHLIDLTNDGRGIERFSDFAEATRFSLRVEKEVGDATRYVRDDAGEIISATAVLPDGARTVPYMGGEFSRPILKEVPLGGPARGTRDTEIIGAESHLTKLEKSYKSLRAQKARVTDPRQHTKISEQIRGVEEAIAAQKVSIQTLKSAARKGKEIAPDRFRIVPARKELMTKQVAAARREEYVAARKELLAAEKAADTNPMGLEVAVKKHENVLDQLTRDGIIDEAIAKRARKVKPGKEVEKQITAYGRGAASEVELPKEMMAEFDRLGYKPVTAGDDVLSTEEIGRFIDLDKHDVGDYTRRASLWETIGASPKFRTDKQLFGLRRATEKAEVADVFDRGGIKISPKQAFERIQHYMEEVNHAGSVVGPGVLGKSGRPRLYKVDPRDLSVDDLFKAFEDVPGFTDATARDLYGALRRGAAYGHELRLMKPLESAHAAGQLLRLNGLPGFSDLVRTWHLKAPQTFDRAGWAQGAARYKPHASADKAYDLARSPNRAPAMRALDDAAEANNIPAQQRDVAKMMLDTTIEAQVKLGRFDSVDDAYKALSVEYAERYVDAPADALFKRVKRAPSHKKLVALSDEFRETKEWYEKSARALAALPLRGTTQVGDKTISDVELFTQIVAAVSPRQRVGASVEQATEVFASIKRGDPEWPTGILPAAKGMLEDIMRGKTIDTWGPARVPNYTGRSATKQVHSRPKVENFYWNLKGELDRVTNDSWMSKLFGYDGTLTTAQYDEITAEVTRVAKDLDWKPAQVQAALWAAVREDYSLELIEESRKLKKAGDLQGAEALRNAALDELDMATIEQYLPASRVAELEKMSNGKAMAYLQKVEDDVRGLTAWGEDGLSVMKFFRNADFSTLVHENAHLMRRILAPEDLARVEKLIGVKKVTKVADDLPDYMSQAKRVNPETKARVRAKGEAILKSFEDAPRQPLKPLTGGRVDEVFDMLQKDWGGGTLNMRSGDWIGENEGQFVGGVADAVELPISQAGDKQAVAKALTEARKKFKTHLEKENHHLGFFRDPEKGIISFEPSLALKTKAEAEAVATARGDAQSFFNLKTAGMDVEDNAFSVVAEEVVDSGWSRQAEERFAEMAERHFLAKADPSNADALMPLKESLRILWGNVRQQAVDSNYVGRGMRAQLDKAFPIPIQFAPPNLAKSMGRGTLNRQTAGGALIGGIAGAYEGREDGILDGDIVHGAAMGAAGGLAARKLSKRNYGYLPDSLMRMNTALRYSLSFTFDLGRFTEQNMIAMAKFNLPPMASPMKNIKSRTWASANGDLTGQAAWDDAVDFWEELNGGIGDFKAIDDMDRRLYQKGMLGFSPRNWEIAQAYQMKARGWGRQKIEQSISEIGRYGLGRTAAEKSANFIVFPFSFSKKFLTTMGDFVMQAPGRNLLLHEGMRRFYESEADDKLQDFMQRRAPLLEELMSVNSLAFGLSPGRFFLQGLSDHRTNTGKAAQIMSSFFVPSGAATSLAQGFGNAADLAVNAFTPIVITGESINRAGGIENFADVMRRYVPLIRELDTYFVGAGEGHPAFGRQLKAFMEGGDPYWQFSQYQEGLKRSKQGLAPIAAALGYSSVDGLLGSDQGMAFQGQVDAEQEQLRQDLPTGFEMSQTFENDDTLNAAAMTDLGNKTNRTPAEEQILSITEQIQSWQMAIGALGLDPEMSASLLASQLRQRGMQHADDPRFVELWNRFFLRDYGPIRRVA